MALRVCHWLLVFLGAYQAILVKSRTTPVCTWDGGVFTGAVADITSFCSGFPSGVMPAAVSVALTFQADEQVFAWPRPLEFYDGTNDRRPVHLFLSALRPAWRDSASGRVNGRNQLVAGFRTRLLMTVTATRMQLFEDGVLRDPVDTSLAIGGLPYTNILLGVGDYRGLIEDVYIFDSEVGWESAVVPYVPPFCQWEGKLFDGSNHDVITDRCPENIGGAVSIAFTLKMDVLDTDRALVVEMQHDDYTEIAEFFFMPHANNPSTLVWKVAESSSAKQEIRHSITLGDTIRVLGTFGNSGLLQLMIDGNVIEVKSTALKIANTSRFINVGKNGFKGLIQDVYIFSRKVGWDSALVTTTTTTTATTTTTSTSTSSTLSTSSTSRTTSSSSTSETTTTTLTVSSTSTTTSVTSSTGSSTSTVTSTTSTSASSTSTSTESSTSSRSSTSSSTMSSTRTSTSTTSTVSSTVTTSTTATTTVSTTTTATTTSTTVTSTVTTLTATTTKTSTGTTVTRTFTATTTTSVTTVTETSTVTTLTATTTKTSTGTTVTRTLTATTTTSFTTVTETSTATATTLTSTVSATTTVTSTRRPQGPLPSSTSTTTDGALQKSVAVSNAVSQGVSSLLQGGNVTSVTVETSLGKVKVVDLGAAVAGGEGASIATETGSKVRLSTEVVKALPAGAMLAILDIAQKESNSTGSAEEDAFESLGSPLASRVMDISVYDAKGQPVKVVLETPLLFKLPDASGGSCVFLDTESSPARWSRAGVRRASEEEVRSAGESPQGVWCLTLHLSIFAAIFQAILGCTNLELFTPNAVQGVLQNEAWYESEPAMIVFGIWALLVLALLLSNLRETWALRLGRTHESHKSVNICRSFMNWGPHMLKHKYMAFVIYARDLFRCLTSHHSKLKNSTLTASVQRFLAVRTGISVQCVTQQCWNSGGWLDSKASLPRTVLCRKLEAWAGGADRVIQDDLGATGPLGCLRRFVMTFLACHPLLDANRVGAGSMSAAKRTAMQIAGICGVIATNALIFNFSGALRSWESDFECPINPTSQFFIVVASLVSILVNAVPNAFLVDLAKQVHGRPAWNAIFWLGTLAYLSLAVFLITVALANLNRKDQMKWHASLRWGMSIKLLGMPLAQAVRNSILMEFFLHEDNKCKPSQRFRVTMGLNHPNECELSEEETQEAETMARQAITAAKLLNFTALLGDVVMPDFDPETSTSDDVMRGAIDPLCFLPPSLEDFPVSIEVVEATGIHSAVAELTCSLLHLDRLSGNERSRISERCSAPAPMSIRGGTKLFEWNMEAAIAGLQPEHALGFLVKETGSLAVLTAEELLEAGEWAGSLELHPIHQEPSVERWAMPSEAKVVRASEISASKGSAAGRSAALLEVRVRLPEGYKAAVGKSAIRSRVSQRGPQHQSEVTSMKEWHTSLTNAKGLQSTDAGSSAAFCKVQSYKRTDPPETLVVHSRNGLFAHLVATVLADALSVKGGDKIVREKIGAGDFNGLHDMLQEAGCEGKQYWIDMFAMSPARRNKDVDWHEGFLSSWPTMLRALRRAVCQKMVADIEARKTIRSPGPLNQLLVIDEEYHFMREQACLAELMLAKSMRVRQRLILHPKHLKGSGLGMELQRLAQELGTGYNSNAVAPYLENRQEVYDTIRDLVVKGVKEKKEDNESTWQELNMTDIFATVAALQAGQSTTSFDDLSGRPRNAESDMEDLANHED